jgi:hypothetical protein
VTSLVLIVFGGRTFDDESFLFAALDFLHGTRGIAKVIQGGAPGADKLAKRWADLRGVPCETVPAEWDNLNAPGAVIRTRRDGTRYNAKAGPDRNAKMLTMGTAPPTWKGGF